MKVGFRWAMAGAMIAAVGAAGCKKEAETSAPGCDVARAYVANRLARFADRTMVVVDAAAPGAAFLATRDNSDLPVQFNPGVENPKGGPKDPASAALAEAWTGGGHASPFASCVDFAKVIEAAGVSMGKVAGGEKPNAAGLFRTQVNFAMPAISADGNEALLMEEGRTTPTSSIVLAVHLRKDKAGAWKETDALTVMANLGL